MVKKWLFCYVFSKIKKIKKIKKIFGFCWNFKSRICYMSEADKKGEKI